MVRDARGQVRAAAAAGDDVALVGALHMLIDAAISAGLARVTISPIAAAALEEVSRMSSSAVSFPRQRTLGRDRSA